MIKKYIIEKTIKLKFEIIANNSDTARKMARKMEDENNCSDYLLMDYKLMEEE